jgi:hypothetical protein
MRRGDGQRPYRPGIHLATDPSQLQPRYIHAPTPRNVAVGDVVIGDTAISAISDVLGADEIVFTQGNVDPFGDQSGEIRRHPDNLQGIESMPVRQGLFRSLLV